MLSLKPPFLETGHIVIFRDDADESCFYYQNMQPHVVRNDEGKPMVSAYALFPKSGTSQAEDATLEAALTLDVDLSPSPAEMEAVRQTIRKNFGVEAKILSPAPVADGRVRFYMASAGEETDTDKWFVTSEVKPSLIGSNRVSLLVRATGMQADMLMAAAMEGDNAATICYELDLVGITPVYHATLWADMIHIYTSLKNHADVHSYFGKADVESVIESSIKDGFIKYEVSEMDPKIQATAENALMEDLRKRILDQFFEPVDLVARANEKDTAQKIGDGISTILDSLLPGSHILRRHVAMKDIQTYHVDLSTRKAKTTLVSPQTVLKTMLMMDGVDMGAQIDWIYLDQIPIIRQPVDIRVPTDMFDDTNIKSLRIVYRIRDLDTGQTVFLPEESVTFCKGKTELRFYYNREKAHQYVYEYQATMFVEDTSSDLIGTEESLTGDSWQQSSTSFVYINPASLYRNLTLGLDLDDITVFDHLKMIEAFVEVVPKGGGKSLFAKRYPFTVSDVQSAHRQLNLLVKKDDSLEFHIHLTYDIPGQPCLEKDYTVQEGTNFLIPNPFQTQWKVDFFCFADWEKCTVVYLDARFRNPVGEGNKVEHFEFRKDKIESVLKVPIAPGFPTCTFEYRVQWINDRKPYSAGWYSHQDLPSLVINIDTLEPEKVFRFRIDDPDFFRKQAFSVFKVNVRYTENGQETSLPSAVFNTPESILEFACPDKATCSYQLIVLDDRGHSPVSSQWRPLQDSIDLISLNISTLISENL